MAKYNSIFLVPGLFDERVGAGLMTDGTDDVLTLTKGEQFGVWLTDKAKTLRGPIGELNRAELHRYIDCWLDGVDYE